MAFIPIHDTNPLRNIKRPWVAWSLIAANVIVYFAVEAGSFAGLPSDASVAAFGLIPEALNGYADSPAAVPDALTLVTYAFLHGDFWHLAGNMIFLWVLADNVEDALGHARYLAFYVVCAIVAGYAYVWVDPASPSPVIGASGAVAGNVSAYLLLHPRAKMWVLVFARIPLRLSAVYVLGFWVVFQVITALTGGDDGVAWWSHVGGLIAGAILVVAMRRPGVKLFDRPAAEFSRPPVAASAAAALDIAVSRPLDSATDDAGAGPRP
jgi:membrane associated rhomboid family serine protease